MIEFPSDFTEQLLDLAPDDLGAAGAVAWQQLAEQGYEVRAGLTAKYAEAIAVMALEPAIREYCPKDSTERFADLATTATWLSKQRGVFLLLRQAEGEWQLAGYGWAGAATSSEVPGGQTTFALRIGENHQGRGLAAPFARLIVAGAAALYGARDIWLETWASNGAAVHTYHKVGFVDVARQPANRPSVAGADAPDTRLYMSLPNDELPPA